MLTYIKSFQNVSKITVFVLKPNILQKGDNSINKVP